MSNDNAPGRYVKGGEVREASTASEAVALRFDGYVPAADQSAEDVAYRDLQSQAKALGIPANQSSDALLAAVTDPDRGTGTPAPAGDLPTPDLDEDSLVGGNS